MVYWHHFVILGNIWGRFFFICSKCLFLAICWKSKKSGKSFLHFPGSATDASRCFNLIFLIMVSLWDNNRGSMFLFDLISIFQQFIGAQNPKQSLKSGFLVLSGQQYGCRKVFRAKVFVIMVSLWDNIDVPCSCLSWFWFSTIFMSSIKNPKKILKIEIFDTIWAVVWML